MATKEELLAQANALRAELDKLDNMIKAIDRCTWERMPYGSTYYYVGFCDTDNASYDHTRHVEKQIGDFSVVISTKEYYVEEDDYNWENGNYFRSAMDAERSWRVRSTEARLRRLADKLNAEAGGLDWDNGNQCKYHLWYDGTTGKIIKGEKFRNQYADMRDVFCIDPDFVAKAIQEIGEANLLIYLGRA